MGYSYFFQAQVAADQVETAIEHHRVAEQEARRLRGSADEAAAQEQLCACAAIKARCLHHCLENDPKRAQWQAATIPHASHSLCVPWQWKAANILVSNHCSRVAHPSFPSSSCVSIIAKPWFGGLSTGWARVRRPIASNSTCVQGEFQRHHGALHYAKPQDVRCAELTVTLTYSSTMSISLILLTLTLTLTLTHPDRTLQVLLTLTHTPITTS